MLKKKKIVNDFEKSALSYFKDISEFSPLQKEEEYSLWEKYRKHNDLSARDKLIKSNLRFVASVAKSYQGLGLSYSDLIAEGNIGLMKAIDKFDYEKGYKTISYSVWWIKQSILEALNKRNAIKGDELPQDFEKPVDTADDDVFTNNDNPFESEEYIDYGISSQIKEKEEKDAIYNIMNCLSEREKFVILNFFGLESNEELTLEEIGKKLKLTKERVRQIKEKALKKLRSEALKNSITTDIYK